MGSLQSGLKLIKQINIRVILSGIRQKLNGLVKIETNPLIKYMKKNNNKLNQHQNNLSKHNKNNINKNINKKYKQIINPQLQLIQQNKQHNNSFNRSEKIT